MASPTEPALLPYQDWGSEGNLPKYRTGKKCIVKGCDEPAGTAWGPWWCVKHNIERMDRISRNLEALADRIRRE